MKHKKYPTHLDVYRPLHWYWILLRPSQACCRPHSDFDIMSSGLSTRMPRLDTESSFPCPWHALVRRYYHIKDSRERPSTVSCVQVFILEYPVLGIPVCTSSRDLGGSICGVRFVPCIERRMYCELGGTADIVIAVRIWHMRSHVKSRQQGTFHSSNAAQLEPFCIAKAFDLFGVRTYTRYEYEYSISIWILCLRRHMP